MSGRRFVVGITGASGAAYAPRLLEVLGQSGAEIHLIVTPWGRRLLKDELGIRSMDLDALTRGHADQVRLHNDKDVGAAPGSGSFVHDGMVVIPCSANTLARVACGMTENLIQRAASCALKERRRLVLCHRETPLSLIDIENMASVTRAGGIIAPLNPGFYLSPNAVNDLIDYMVARVLDLLGVEHSLDTSWEDHLNSESPETDAPSTDSEPT